VEKKTGPYRERKREREKTRDFKREREKAMKTNENCAHATAR
jgi:hypothetical protein